MCSGILLSSGKKKIIIGEKKSALCRKSCLGPRSCCEIHKGEVFPAGARPPSVDGG